jgi:proteasome assembly chaperone 2
MTFFYPETKFEFSGKSLIVVCAISRFFHLLGITILILSQPIISTANIGQLAVDLLIASLSLRCVGVFDARDLVPVVGGREDGKPGVTTPLECTFNALGILGIGLIYIAVYGREGVDILVIQQRSPALKASR